MTEIGRDGDIYWMLKMNWFQDNLVAQFAQEMLVMGTAVEKNYIYRYNDGILQSFGLSPEIGFEHGKQYWNLTLCTHLENVKDNLEFWFVLTSKEIWIWILNWFHARRTN